MRYQENNLTYHQQLKIIIMLSLAFMLMFTSYSSVEGILTKFYETNGHKYYGRITLITAYACFGLSTTFASALIGFYGYKAAFVIGAISYALFDSSALIIYFTDNQTISLLTILFTSAISGTSAGSIWVAANAYIGLICTKDNINGMFGIFQSIRSLSVIIGCALTVYIFKYYGGYAFFLTLIPISILSVIIFLLLPSPTSLGFAEFKKIGDENEVIGFAKIKRYFSLLTIRQNFQIYSFETLNAFPAAIISNLAYKIVDVSLSVEINESDQQYKNRLTYSFGVTLVWYGIGRTVIGFLIKKLNYWMNHFELCQLSAYINVLSILIGCLSLYFKCFDLCCFFAFNLGISFGISRSSVSILVKEVFKNNFDMIGISCLLQALSFITNVLLMLVLTNISLSLCLFCYLSISFVIAKHTRKLQTIYKQKDIGDRMLQLKDRLK